MTQHPCQMNYVVFSQYNQGLMAVSDQLRVDFTLVKCFNCSLTLCENIDAPFVMAAFNILISTHLSSIRLGLKYCGIPSWAEYEPLSRAMGIHCGSGGLHLSWTCPYTR
jgi:hypothetical protein